MRVGLTLFTKYRSSRGVSYNKRRAADKQRAAITLPCLPESPVCVLRYSERGDKRAIPIDSSNFHKPAHKDRRASPLR